MKFFKILLFFLLFTVHCSLFTNLTMASDQFAVDASVNYKVTDTGKTKVTHNITLENLYSQFYATTYTLSLENISAENINALDDKGNKIPFEEIQDNNKLSIKLTFADVVAGVNKKRSFAISYENSNFAVKTGEVWEVSIPRLSDNGSFRNYEVVLDVPDLFGQEAYISPQPESSVNVEGVKRYFFSKEKVNQTGVTAGFGQFQVFSFNLSYHLENPLNNTSQTEIAIPPDTAFQKVYLNKLSPKPTTVRIDGDGNYLAVYKLTARQRIDVTADGYVQIFAGYRQFPVPSKESLQRNLLESNYWQSTDPQIKSIAKDLKTPQEIYNYVSNKLKYDFSRVQPNVTRMGAVKALANPEQAICIEFTDLFIAISRASGIPAREINGYAYTENKELQPLSLVADVLHSWPEYYDAEKNAWIPVDPTWGSTSGVDFFNKLDLRHFAFVIHGASDKEPYAPGSYKLGPNPQKDVFVSFGKLPINRNSIPQITVSTDRNLPFISSLYTVNVYNPGPSTMYSFYPTIYFDNTLHSKEQVQILPPYSSYSNKIELPFSLLGKNTPDNIKIVANEVQVSVPINKSQVVINSLIVLFVLFIIFVIFVLVKLKKINFERFIDTIGVLYAKFTRKAPKNINSVGKPDGSTT